MKDPWEIPDPKLSSTPRDKIAEATVQLQAIQYGLDQTEKLLEQLTAARVSMRANLEEIYKLLTTSASFQPAQMPKEEPKQELPQHTPAAAQEELPSSPGTEPLPENLDTEKIIWEDAEGKKGPYEKAVFYTEGELTGAMQLSNEHFKVLEIRLAGKGISILDGKIYWVFQDQKAIGRKTSKGRRRA